MATGRTAASATSRASRSRVVEYEQYIDAQLKKTRSHVKLTDLCMHLLVLFGGTLLLLLGAAVIEHWLVPGGMGPFLRAVGFLAVCTWIVWYVVRRLWPLMTHRINPAFAAQAIEQNNPSLKNSLLNLLFLRSQRGQVPGSVYQAVEQQAATRLASADVDPAVDRSQLIRIGYAVVALVIFAAVYKVASPKDPLASAARVLAPWADISPPTRVAIEDIAPGDLEIARGETVEISVEVHGARRDEPVVLRYSTSDGQAAGVPIEMSRQTDTYRYLAELPPRRDKTAVGPLGLQQSVAYWIEAGDARSREFEIKIADSPTIVVQTIEYDFPEYTGFQNRTQYHVGDIRAIEGTQITMRALTNEPIRTAHIDFNFDGRKDRALDHDGPQASIQFALRMGPDRVSPEHHSYGLRFTGESGRHNAEPIRYRIEVTPDYVPEIAIVRPEKDTIELPVDEALELAVDARDPDFALSHVAFQGAVVGGDREHEFDVPLLQQEHTGRFTSTFRIVPAELELAVGERVEVWAVAIDNKQPEPNVAVSARKQIDIRASNKPDRSPNDPEQRPNDEDSAEQDSANNAEDDPRETEPEEGQEPGEGEAGEGDDREGDPNQGDPGQGESGQGESGQGESGQGETGEGESGEGESGQGESGEGESGQGESGQGESGQGESGQGESGEGESGQGESGQGESGAAGASDSGQGDPGGGESGDGTPGADESGQTGEGESAAGESGESGGGEPGESGQAADGTSTGEASEVASDGSGDAEAFERIARHMEQQREQQQPSDPQRRGDGGERESGTADPGQSEGAGGNGETGERGERDDRGEGTQGEPPQQGGPNSGDDPQADATADRNAADESATSDSQAEETPNGSPSGDAEGESQDGSPGRRESNGGSGQGTDSSRPEGDASGEGSDAESESDPNGDPSGEGPDDDPRGDGQGEAGEREPGQDTRGNDEQGQDEQGQESGQGGPSGESNRQDGPTSQAGGPRQDEDDASAQRRQDDGDAASPPGGGENNTQGPPGGGNQDGEQGSPRSESDPQPSPKREQDGGRGDSQEGQDAPAAPKEGSRESDSQGETGGERPGGGDEGAGQQTPRDGTGSAGQNQSADEGGGRSTEKGDGENSDEGGGDQVSDRPTGDSSQDRPGQGSDRKPGQGDQPSGDPSQEGAGEMGDGPPRDDDPRRPSANEGQQQEAPQGDSAPPSEGSGGGNQSGGGGRPGSATRTASPQDQGGDFAGDAANLEYARKQTDMILDSLENQLERGRVDQELLDSMGWTQDDVRRFVDRWKALKKAPQAGADPQRAKQNLDAALRALGLRKSRVQRQGNDRLDDRDRNVRDAARSKTPPEFRNRAEQYVRGVSRSR